MIITRTAIPNDVNESFVFPSKNKAEYMRIIMPARTTDIDNPVKIIYNMINAPVIIIRVFFLTLSKDRIFSIPADIIERWNPLSANMWVIPSILKSSFIWSPKKSLSPKKSAENKLADL